MLTVVHTLGPALQSVLQPFRPFMIQPIPYRVPQYRSQKRSYHRSAIFFTSRMINKYFIFYMRARIVVVHTRACQPANKMYARSNIDSMLPAVAEMSAIEIDCINKRCVGEHPVLFHSAASRTSFIPSAAVSALTAEFVETAQAGFQAPL